MLPPVSVRPVAARLSVSALPTCDDSGQVSSSGSLRPNLFRSPSSDGAGPDSLHVVADVGFGVTPGGKCRTSALSAGAVRPCRP